MALTRAKINNLDTSVEFFTDPQLTLNSSGTAANIDVGLVFNRNGGNVSNVAIFWQERTQSLVFALTSNSGITTGNIVVSSYANIFAANVVASGNITAPYFVGNGSQLTGISTSSSSIFNNASNVTVTASYVNVAVNGSNVAAFSSTGLTTAGNLTVQGNLIVLGNLTSINIDTINTTEYISSTGNLVINNAAPSTSSTTGVIVTQGGVGIGGNLNAGSLSTPGSLHTLAGNVTIYGASSMLNVIGNIVVNNTAPSTSTTTGALQVTGGVGVGGTLNIGGFANISSGSVSTDSALQIYGNVSRGGAGYHDFLRVTSTASGAINPNMFFRLNGNGNLQIINSGYSAQLFELQQSGNININGTILTAGTAGTPGYVLSSTGTGLAWVAQTGGGGSNYSNANVAAYLVSYTGNISAANIIITGAGQFSGPYNENTTVSGVYAGNLNLSPRVGFFNGTAAQNWQIDNNFGTFRWYTPGVTRMTLDTNGQLNVPGYINTAGNILSAGGIFNALTVNGGITSSGYINTTANISTAQLNAGQINTTGNILATTGVFNNVIINTGNINAVGGYFIGNGAFLTGIITPIPNQIYSGSSNVTVTAAYVNVAIGGSNVACFTKNGLDGTAIGNSFPNTGTFSLVNSTGNILTSNLTVFGNSTIGSVATAGGITNIIGNIYQTGTGTVFFSTTGNILTAQLNAGQINTTGNIISANIITANIVSNGNINAVSGYFIGNGSQLTGLPTSYSNVQVATYLQSGNISNISVAGNVTATYFIGNGSQLTSVPGVINKLLYSGTATVNTLVTLVDSVTVTGNTAVNWTLTSNDNINNSFKSSILNTVNDGTNVYYNEYAIITSNSRSTVATFTSNITGGNVNLYANGISSSVTIAFQRNLLGSNTTTGYLVSGPTGPQGNAGPTNYSNVNVAAWLSTVGTLNQLVFSSTATIDPPAPALIDSIPVAGNTSVNWQLTSTDIVSSNFRSSMLNSINDGANVYYNEYAVITSNSVSQVSTFTSNIANGNIQLWATAVSNRVTISFKRSILGSSTVTGYIGGGPIGPQGNAGPTSYSNINVTAYLGTGQITTANLNVLGSILATSGITATAANINGSMSVSGITSFNNVTNSVPYQLGSGAIYVAGGMSIAKDIWVSGNIYAGNLISTTANILTVQDSLVYLQNSNTYPYNYSIGFYGHYTGGPANTYVHTAMMKNYTDGAWYFISNIAEPTVLGNINVGDSNRILDTIIAGNLNLSSNLVVGANTTIGGNLVVSSNITTNSYFIGNGSQLTGVVTSGGFLANASPPVNPRVGSQWWDTTTGIIFEYISDGTNNVWVDTTSPTITSNVQAAGSNVFTTLTTTGNLYVNSGYGSANIAYGCRAWVSFGYSSGNLTVYNQGSISSVTRNATGDYTITFGFTMPDTTYAMIGTSGQPLGGTAPGGIVVKNQDAPVLSNTAIRIYTLNPTSSTATDYPYNYIAFFR